MRNFTNVAWVAVAAGLLLPGATALRADDWRGMRSDSREIRHDYAAVERLRAEIARDEWRLNEDIRRGRRHAIRQDRRELERDQRALDSLLYDLQRDRREMYRDSREYRGNEYRNDYRRR
jgi:hypothetical protein